MHRSRSVAALVTVFLVQACAPANQDVHAQEAPVDVVVGYADTTALRIGAQSVVDAFASEVASARGSVLAQPPAVEVRNTPQLISFSRSTNRVTVPWWDTMPEQMRAVMRTFADGGDAEAEHLFRVVFNRFLIAHEAAHWYQDHAQRRMPTLYENENAANRLAVAFWRTQPDGERFLAELEEVTSRAADALPDPTPPGEDPVAYFGANYQTLGADPLKYGYYQFRFMRDAVRERAHLDFAEMVRQ